MSKYQVDIKVVKVPVPADQLVAWKASVARLYERLEEEVQKDKEAERISYVQSNSGA